MTKTFCFRTILFFCAVALGHGNIGWAADEQTAKAALDSMPSPMQAGQPKLNAVIDTLNQTLVENKDLREQIKNLQASINEITLENNVLRYEVRRSQGDIDRAQQSAAQEKQKIETELDEAKQVLTSVAKESNAIRDQYGKLQSSASVMENDNVRLQKLLNRAILEGERDQYNQLIQKSQRTNQAAIMEVSKKRKENAQMKKELAALYYNMGNVDFEAARYKNAELNYKKAVSLNKNDSWAYYNLALIYDYYLPNRKKALSMYRKYLRLEKAEDAANKIRARVIELEMRNEIAPNLPLTLDFKEYQNRLNRLDT